jgi:hypothetical protein
MNPALNSWFTSGAVSIQFTMQRINNEWLFAYRYQYHDICDNAILCSEAMELYDVKQTKNNAVVIKDQFYILIHA